MSAYGECLSKKDQEKGDCAKNLAGELEQKAQDFFKSINSNSKTIKQFEDEFKILLHS